MENLNRFGELGQKAEHDLYITKAFLNTDGMPFEFVRGKLADTLVTITEMVSLADVIMKEREEGAK